MLVDEAEISFQQFGSCIALLQTECQTFVGLVNDMQYAINNQYASAPK